MSEWQGQVERRRGLGNMMNTPVSACSSCLAGAEGDPVKYQAVSNNNKKNLKKVVYLVHPLALCPLHVPLAVFQWLGSHLNTKTHYNGHIFMFKGKGERW